MSGLTWPDGDRTLTDCPLGCGQTARLDLHGDRLLAKCFASCEEDAVVGALDAEAIKAEMESRRVATADEVREVLDAVEAFLDRFLVMSDSGLAVLSAWVLHTWLFEAAETTPYISVRSPARESGKTRVIEIAVLLVRQPIQTEDITVSALFRSIERWQSTLLLDEVDTIFKARDEDSKDLRRLLNGGYRLGGGATRTVGDSHQPKQFPTFSPKLLAGLGGLPDTLESRCVPIAMQRRLPHERVERLRLRRVRPEAELLVERLKALAVPKLIETLQAAEPALPDELGDRAQDCAEPLLAIAEYAEGDWAPKLRRALVELRGGQHIEDESASTRLLGDIRTVFGEQERITSSDLLSGLHEIDDAPWNEWFGRPLSFAKLGKLLHDFDIHSRTIRVGEKTAKGFQREQFEEAWARYLPAKGERRNNPQPRTENSGSGVGTAEGVLPLGNGSNPAPQAGCNGVPAQDAGPGGEAAAGSPPTEDEMRAMGLDPVPERGA